MNRKRLILTLVILVSFVMTSFAGVEYSMTMKTSSKNKRLTNDIIAHVYAQGGNVKQVWEGVANENMMYSQKGFWLYKAKEETIYVVNEQKETYMAMSLDDLKMMTGMMGGIVKMEIIDHTVKSENLPKETVAGYSCNHVKITTDYTMKMKITVFKKTFKIHEVKEIWSTPGMPGLNEMHKAFAKKDFQTGIEAIDELIKKEMAQQKNLGFPLKMITHQVQMNKKGKVKSETTSTMEVSKIKKGTFPKEFFEIPGGYQQVKSPAESAKIF